ncbi:MAG: inosine/xanthosine triphosphatase [Candidatus Hadarchaeales archaeon]
MKVCVGSTNPTKVMAVERVFSRIFRGVKVVGMDVNPGVSIQPMSEREIVRGAIGRAKMALKAGDGDFGVGIEGGVARFGGRWYNLGFVAIVDKRGRIGTGTSGWFECPPKILRELKKGRELGDVMDDLTGRKNTKRSEGAIGIFTRGAVDRTSLYEHAVWMALCRFLSPEFFR